VAKQAASSGNDYASLAANIKARQFSSVYFLEGDEPFYIDAIADLIEENALQDFEKEFNQSILYGKDVDISKVLNEAKRYPMMADKQVVIVREAQDIKDLDKIIITTQGKTKLEYNLLEEYLKNPQSTTILVFCYKYKKIDARKSLAKIIKKQCAYLHSEKLKDYQLSTWLDTFCKQEKIAITPKANSLLCEYLGNDLQKMSNEISKLLVNKKGNRSIDEVDVQTNIGISKDYNVFEFQNALFTKDVLKSNRIALYYSQNTKEHPLVMVISFLYGAFTKILLLHSLADKSESSIASALKIHPFIAKDYIAASKKYGFEKCMRIISYLREADAKGKGVDIGEINIYENLKELTFKILH
jgi:DNA polymerase-3 subunit delta